MNYDKEYEQQMADAEGQAMAEQAEQFKAYLDMLVEEKQFALLAFEIVLDHLTGYMCSEGELPLLQHLKTLRDKFEYQAKKPKSTETIINEIPF